MDDMTQEELEFIKLAGNLVRHVRTPEGARFYDLPMGAVITADIIKAKKLENAAKGIKAPKGGVTSKKHPNVKGVKSAGAQGPTDYTPGVIKVPKTTAPKTHSAGTGVQVPQSAIEPPKVIPSSIHGPHVFKVGNSEFSAPEGSRIFTSSKHPEVSYILDPDGTVHPFNQSGELTVDPALKDILDEKFSNFQKNDPNYTEGKFDSKKSVKLADKKPGTILKKNGKPLFKKQDDGNWANEDTGLQMTDDELQSGFDSGKYEVQDAHVQETDFSSMSVDETSAALETMPTGKELGFGMGKITKQKNGMWKSSINGKTMTSEDVADLTDGTQALKDKVDDYKPEEPKKPGKSKKNEGPIDPLTNPDNFNTPENAKKKDAEANKATGNDILSAKEGDAFFHKSLGPVVKKGQDYHVLQTDVPVHQDHVAGSANNGLISKKPYTDQHQKMLDDHKNAQSGKNSAETPQEGDTVNAQNIDKLVASDIIQHKDTGKTYVKNSNGNWVSADGGVYSPDNFESKVGLFSNFFVLNSKNSKNVGKPGIPEGAKQVDSIKDFNVGETIHVSNENGSATLKKVDNGIWEDTESGFAFTDEDVQLDVKDGNVWAKDIPSSKKAEPTLDAPPLVSNDEPSAGAKKFAQKDVIKQRLMVIKDNFKDSDYEDGNAVDNVDILHDAPVGTVLKSNDGHDSFFYKKMEDEKWYGVDKYSTTGGYDSNVYKSDIDAGWITLQNKKSAAQFDEHISDSQAGLMSTNEINDAVNALESHSHFSVKYGLKSLPDSHPLKDNDYLASVQAAANLEYPNLPPKQALVKHLKKGEGDPEPLAPWEQELLNGSSVPEHMIGSTEPKKTATGVTGGTYNEKDIQDAIDILEKYNGKLFKAELNNHGNPLGELSPNHLVGFDKDKTVTKQKFIDLLKKKLDKPEKNSPPVQADKPAEKSIDQQIMDGDISLKKAKELQAQQEDPWAPKESAPDVTKEPEKGDAVKSVKQLNDAAIGTIVSRKTFSGNINKYEKTDDGKWTNIDTGQGFDADGPFNSWIGSGSVVWDSIPDKSHNGIVNGETNINYASMDKNKVEDFLKAAPTGFKVWLPFSETENKEFYFSKNEHGTWSSNLDSGIIPNKNMAGFKDLMFNTPQKKWVKGSKVINPNQMKYFGQGDKVSVKRPDGELNHYTRTDDGTSNGWKDDETGQFFDVADFEDSIDKGRVTFEGHKEVNPGDTLDKVAAIQHLPTGSVIDVNGVFYTKNKDQKWENNDTSKVVGTSAFYNQILAGNVKAHSIGDDKVDIPDSGEKTPVTYEQVQNMKPGARLFADTGLPGGSTYTKHDDGVWRRQDGSLVSAAVLQAFSSKGKLTLVNDDPNAGPKVGDKLDGSFNATDALPGTVLQDPFGYTYTKQENGNWKSKEYEHSNSTIQSSIENSSEQWKLKELSHVEESPHNLLTKGDKVSSTDQIDNMANGDKLLFHAPTMAGPPYHYVKTGYNQWKETETGSITDSEGLKFGVKHGYVTYDGNEGNTTHGNDGESSLDAIEGEAYELLAQLKAGDKHFTILPESERGESGDDFVVVHTKDGPKPVWGKYGAGGIAAIGRDKDGTVKVLVGKRGDRDEWYLPGGAIDENETHIQGSLREFSEEVDGGHDIAESMDLVKSYQSSIGKVDGTDRDWKYVTSVFDMGEIKNITAPKSNEPWELSEYQWFSADELKDLEASGKLHGALTNGTLAKMVGFEPEDDNMGVDLTDNFTGSAPDDIGEVKYDVSGWKKVGGQGGYNSGGVYEDNLGNKYYVKSSGGGEEASHTEVLASALYRATGVNSNEVFLGKNGSDPKTLLVSPWVDNNPDAVANAVANGDNPELLKKVQEDFAVDAWLANYDVVGNDTWNVVTDAEGNPLRIDPGGALNYRGTGGKKAWWSENPTDIDDMRYGSSQSGSYVKASHVFGSMTDDEVKESAKKLLNITPEQINDIVRASGLSDEAQDEMVKTLTVRRQKILDRFGLTEADKPKTEFKASNGLTVSPKAQELYDKGFKISAMAEVNKDNASGFADAKQAMNQYALIQANGGKLIQTATEKSPNYGPYKKGSDVWVKKTGEKIKVDMATNEVTAGVGSDGKYTLFLNDEIMGADDYNHNLPGNYAFTANGEAFSTGETVHIPNPDGGSNLVEGQVVSAGLSNGVVTVSVGDKIVKTDKHNILKTPKAEPAKVTLPVGYDTPPVGSTVFAKNNNGTSAIVVQHPNGQVFTYYQDGTAIESAHSPQQFLEHSNWDEYHGEGVTVSPGEDILPKGYTKPPVGSVAIAKHDHSDAIIVQHPDGSLHKYFDEGSVGDASADKAYYEKSSIWKPYSSAPKGPPDIDGTPLEVGHTVTIAKYAHGVNHNAKVIAVLDNGKVKVEMLDEHGYPVKDANGKKKIGNLDAKNLRKQKTVGEGGIPSGVTVSTPNKEDPLYRTPEPTPPQIPDTSEVIKSSLPVEWEKEADEAYNTWRKNIYGTEKPLKSSQHWTYFESALNGDEDYVNVIKNNGWLDSNSALYDQLKEAITEQKKKVADLVANHMTNVEQYQRDHAAWAKANGVTTYTPFRHEDAVGMNQDEAEQWASNRWSGFADKLSSKARNALETQKYGSDWQTAMRKLPAILGLKREDIAATESKSHMDIWDGIQEATHASGPIGTGILAARTIDFDRLVDADGNPLDSSSDLSKLIGTIQKDHGGMEVIAGGVHTGGEINHMYPVVMDLAIPPEVHGFYTGIHYDSFPHGGEHGMILEPGLAMYISDAKKEYINGSTRWVVKASIIPREVLPYMNDFAGDPDKHNIYMPGKDMTTGVSKEPVPEVKPFVPPVQSGGWTLGQLDTVAVGGTVTDSFGTVWEKVGPNEYQNINGSSVTGETLAGKYMDTGV